MPSINILSILVQMPESYPEKACISVHKLIPMSIAERPSLLLSRSKLDGFSPVIGSLVFGHARQAGNYAAVK